MWSKDCWQRKQHGRIFEAGRRRRPGRDRGNRQNMRKGESKKEAQGKSGTALQDMLGILDFIPGAVRSLQIIFVDCKIDAMNGIFVSPSSSYVETLIPSVVLFGDVAFGR